ncbi:MAG: hypothetical protein WCX33_02735, partial [Candidatus Shapirobacteria bacterium]
MSLTQTAYTSRQVIKFGGSGLIIFVFLWTVISTGYKLYIKAHPPYIAPTAKYGILPKNTFPEKLTEQKTFSFELPNDVIPTFKDQAKVYVIYRPNTTFLALEEDTKTAIDFGFESKPTEIKPGIYEFKNDTLNRTLTVNVLDGDFKMTYPYTSDQMLLEPKSMPKKEEAVNIASSFLEKGNKLTSDLDEGEKKVSFWQIQGTGLKAVSSQAEANAARVDFYRKNLDDFNLVSTNYGQASVSVLVSGSDVEGKRVIEVNFKDITIDRESFSTYQIKTAQEAINDLNNGNYWTAVDVNNKNV